MDEQKKRAQAERDVALDYIENSLLFEFNRVIKHIENIEHLKKLLPKLREDFAQFMTCQRKYYEKHNTVRFYEICNMLPNNLWVKVNKVTLSSFENKKLSKEELSSLAEYFREDVERKIQKKDLM